MNDFKTKQSEGGGLWRWESTWLTRGRRTHAYNASITTRLLRVAPGCYPRPIWSPQEIHLIGIALASSQHSTTVGVMILSERPCFAAASTRWSLPSSLPLVEWAPKERGNGSWPGPARLWTRWRKSMFVPPSSSGLVKKIVDLTDMCWPEWPSQKTKALPCIW